jgi:hypothetical protein
LRLVNVMKSVGSLFFFFFFVSSPDIVIKVSGKSVPQWKNPANAPIGIQCQKYILTQLGQLRSKTTKWKKKR